MLASVPPWMLYAVVVVLGLVVGSFINVVVYRLPLMLQRQWQTECAALLEGTPPAQPKAPFNLLLPNSHCPGCDHPVRPYDNLPVLSYLLLRGRCRHCGMPIAVRYPLVEVGAAGLAALVLLQLGPGIQMAAALLLVWTLLTLTLIDIDHQLLPDDITLPLLWLGLLLNLNGLFVPLADAVLGAIAGYLSLWAVYWVFKLLTGKEGMGYGDFKLLAALGAWLGWQLLPVVILLSSLVGAVVGIALLLARRQGRETPMPFGPYLAAAGLLALLFGDTILAVWLGG